MKKLFLLIACLFMSHSMIGLNAANKVIVNGNLNKYIYAYVIPTSGVTSSSGGSGVVFGNKYGVFGSMGEGSTRTVNPSEKISGQLMKMGFTILPNPSPEFADNTIIVSYGYVDGEIDVFETASATILIQFRDAKTQELMASYETTGKGENQSTCISDAISTAMGLFQYTIDPKIAVEFGDIYKKSFYVYLTNRTIDEVNNINLHITYYIDGEVIHEQDFEVKSKMKVSDELCVKINRDKPAQSNKMQIRVKVVSYK